jgi:hypothetical protein
MAKRIVTYARLHQNYYSPGVGEMKGTFPSTDKSLDNLVMETDERANLELTFTFRGLKKHILIPAANVAGMDLAPVVAPAPAVKVVKAAS